MQDQPDPRIEIGLGVFLIAFSAVIYVGTLSLPAPKFEPLGSAALPAILSGIMAALSLVMIVRAALLMKAAKPKDPATQGQGGIRRYPGLAAVILLLTVVFVAVMDLGIAGFTVAGIGYVALTVFFLNHRNMKKLPWIVIFAVLIVVSSNQIFTRLFYIDLP